jgi:hypothetical protein
MLQLGAAADSLGPRIASRDTRRKKIIWARGKPALLDGKK